MAELIAHRSTRGDSVGGIRATARRSASGALEFTFWLTADLSRIRIPTPRPVRVASELWKHTCFEAFIAIEGQAEYVEFNFAPSSEWAAYAFRGYRYGDPLEDDALEPSITVRITDDGLELGAVIRLDRLSRLHARAALRIGLSAVIEASDGTLSYWALLHATEKPDFHDAASFALRLESPDP